MLNNSTFQTIKNFAVNLLTGGIKGNLENDDVRKAVLINFFSILITFGVSVFIVEHLISKRYSTVAFLLVCVAICILNIVFLRVKKKAKTSGYITSVFVLILFKLVLFKFGVGDSGAYWYYLYPVLVFFLLGKTVGLIFSLVNILIAFIFLKFPLPGFIVYPAEYHVRFLIIYLLNCGAIYVFELVREKSFFAFQIANAKKTAYLNKTIQQKEEIETQAEQLIKTNSILQSKNKQILDNINYACIIQEAILPAREYLNSIFSDSFVIYKPRDIVSGDFYWLQVKNDYIYFALCDCTGHGVSGAFMSMIGNTLLNEITSTNQHLEPSQILAELNIKIHKALKQGGNNSTAEGDGMDISLCRIHKGKREFLYSATNQPLFVFDNGELSTISGDIVSIGSLLYLKRNFTYRQSLINYSNSSIFYFSTDGFYDQLDAAGSNTFQKENLQKLIEGNHDLSLVDQEKVFCDTFEKHKTSTTQTDDVTLIAIKIE